MKIKAALISMRSDSSKWIVKAMKKYFDEVDDYDIREIEVNMGKKPEVLYKGKPIQSYDCIYAKGSFRYNPLLRAISSILNDKCYMPIKPTAFTIGQDKLLTQLKLDQNNIPMPKTYLASTTKAARGILKKVNYPIIMKFPEGTQGKGVMFADSFAGASSLLDALTALKQPFLIQEYVETGGTDIRAVVIGDEVVAMKRTAEQGEERANIHRGGKGKAITLDYEAKKIAVDAAKTIGAEICAVDLLEGFNEYFVIEVNLSPGLQGITKTTNVDVADKIAKYLYERTKAIKTSEKEKQSSELIKTLEKGETERDIIMNLTFRGEKILLPELAKKISKFSEDDEVCLKLKKGRIVVEKS